MALSEQVSIYSLGTDSFFDSYEKKMQIKIMKLKARKNKLELVLEKLEKCHMKLLKTKLINITDEITAKLERHYKFYDRYHNILSDRLEKYTEYMNHEISICKRNLTKHFRIRQIRATYHGYNNFRTLNKKDLKDSNTISMFNSTLTRTFGMSDRNKIYNDIIIVRIYYFEVLKNLIDYGFNLNGEKYVYYASSAGQIRTKKCVFVKEKLLNKHRMSLTCGLTVERINDKGGCNINKYLAYTALTSSATEIWDEFDIDKSIVVDDFESPFNDWVDYIDYNDYSIERKKMDVIIPNTDGAGIMLQGKTNTTMVRMPFVKGLMIVCPFDKFIREHKRKGYRNCGIVKDIYGKEHDVLAEDIRWIFTKSQFKMWKYFDSWDEYKENFHKYNCEACKCNEEEEEIGMAKINYQMLQTLSDMTDEEILSLAKETQNDIDSIGNDRKKMLEIMGVTDDNQARMSNLQECLKIYPELLQDVYLKETLKQTKASLVKGAKSGGVKINGMYTFACPDTYAFMEWLFLGIENPKGLLNTGEVYCNLFEDGKDLCCLRSPHLYHEWAIRKNTYGNNDIKFKKWFIGKGIFTSTRDMITKILMMDVDGDHLLVADEPMLINIANRNRKEYDFVPLYYDMKKAEAQEINNDNLFTGLTLAFTGGNIGVISNNISKCWNKMKRITRDMSADECYEAFMYNVDTIRAIKLLVMENNFVID